MKRSRQIIMAVLTLAALLLVAIPVSATAPIRWTENAETDTPAIIASPCPGIELWDHEFYTALYTLHLDNEGNPLRLQVQAKGTDNFYNPANPGVVLSGSFVANYSVDMVTGVLSETGGPYHITVPGYGTVLVRAGRWSGGDHLAGKDSLDNPQDVAQLCALLAGD